jgi:hypothetical protein
MNNAAINTRDEIENTEITEAARAAARTLLSHTQYSANALYALKLAIQELYDDAGTDFAGMSTALDTAYEAVAAQEATEI